MDFKQFSHLLKRRWLSIALLTMIALAVSGLLSWQATPQFESKARVFVSVNVEQASDAFVAALAANGRVASYSSLATSGDLMEQVIDDLNLELSPSQLAERLRTEVVPDTTIIELTARDPDPDQAQLIARWTSQRLTEYLTDLETPSGSASTQVMAEVTGPASYSDTPVSPRTALNLAVAGLVGLLLGITLAITRDLLDRSVTSLQRVHELTDAPVLASVGFDKGIGDRPLLTDLGGFAPRTEAFRLLRTNLQFLDLDEQPRCLVISSAVPAEGKTMTSTNLAIALAQAGRRTLLIDGDLRRPRVAGLLGLDGAVGLTSVLVGSTSPQDAIQLHEPSGLFLLASGPKAPNPTEILQARLTSELFQELRTHYEMIIIDAPPLLPVADASVLSTLADGTILVVRHGKTTRDQLAEAVTRLHHVGGRLFGVVVNMIPRRATKGYYYYYEEASPVRPTLGTKG